MYVSENKPAKYPAAKLWIAHSQVTTHNFVHFAFRSVAVIITAFAGGRFPEVCFGSFGCFCYFTCFCLKDVNDKLTMYFSNAFCIVIETSLSLLLLFVSSECRHVENRNVLLIVGRL